MTERLECRFGLRAKTGRVLVTLSTNDDPVALGHPLVAPRFDARAFRGFPIVRASVEYEGIGLSAVMGWLQVIRHIDPNGTETDLAVDRFPLGPDDSPLYTYGYLPTFFDAPANPDHPDGEWRAETWLVVVPDVVRTRRIAAVVGFDWGYRLKSGHPVLLPLTALPRSDWSGLLPRLRAEHPRWEFLEDAL